MPSLIVVDGPGGPGTLSRRLGELRRRGRFDGSSRRSTGIWVWIVSVLGAVVATVILVTVVIPVVAVFVMVIYAALASGGNG
jgi:Flp pilus assembly protein TadB